MQSLLGLESSDLARSSSILTKALANTFILYLKTWGFHWNIEGAQFPSLHKFLEEEYETLQGAVDEIAERHEGAAAAHFDHDFFSEGVDFDIGKLAVTIPRRRFSVRPGRVKGAGEASQRRAAGAGCSRNRHTT